jgi:hypothetical protein
LALPLTHAARVASFTGPPTAGFESLPTNPLKSDTGELKWDASGAGTGLVTVDTPQSQALIGHVAKQSRRTKNLRAEIQTPFCALTLGSLDNQPVSASSKLLLTATARAANSGMVWNAKRTSLEQWGTAPTRIEPVQGQITLTGLEQASEVRAQPLDGAGLPLGPSLALTRTAEGWVLTLGPVATTWFVIAVDHQP